MRTSFPLLAGMLASALLAGCSRPAAEAEPVRAVRTVVVAAQSAGGSAEYAAEVRARTESRLSFRVGGKITRRHVDLGDTVKAGQVLAQLDPQDLRLGETAAQAAVRAAQVNFDLAAADLKRYRELRDQGFISGAELERRQTTMQAAQAQLEQARAQAGVQANQAAYSSLVADVAGVITGVDAEPGAVVSAGTPVLRLAHDGPRDVVFTVPEDRLTSVRALLGRPGAVQVTLWGSGEQRMPASVREVAAAADPVTRTFLVKADVGNAPVRLGQTATASIAQARVDNVTKLPLSAVFEQQGASAVWVVDVPTMTVRAQRIQVGGADGRDIVVTGGLQPGQRVVSAGVHVLTQGQKVSLYAEPGSPPATPASAASTPR
ncbi:efflux RND transporter periplasmic adaptor subunit [Aquincola sp. MAHUQ-54]|uniref:Efflux RND transporter periplasmic adaptor subunit n=1 Tax=Aquincola agrisoli TaxID=3119538 RepID=A0AAW9QGD1_9BURK